MPKVSIVIPVFRVEKYIDNCLNSLLNQTFKDYEIIFVDDGSPDNSGKLCDEYASKYPFVKVIHQQNAGAGRARNAGLEIASGQYVTFTDADDWAEPEMLDKSVDVLDSGYDLVMFGNYANTFNDKEDKIVKKEVWSPKGEYKTQKECREAFCQILFTTSFNTPWNKLYKMSIIQENNVRFPDIRRGQDAVFNMEYFKYINSFCLIPDALYDFRINTKDKVWKKFPKDLYKIDIFYDDYIVDMAKFIGQYNGELKDKIDALTVNSIFRTINFCKNPYWDMNRKQKLEYVKEIVSQEYYQKRLKELSFEDSYMEEKRKILLGGDSKKILKAVNKDVRKNAFYEGKLYAFLRKIKKAILGK